MSRVLLTGGGGFVGQWLARALIERGDDVTLAGLGSLSDGPRGAHGGRAPRRSVGFGRHASARATSTR